MTALEEDYITDEDYVPDPPEQLRARTPSTMRLRHGVCHQLEEEADRLIAESLRGVSSRTEKSDILTAWKLEDRTTREVLTSTGFADPAVRKGMYHRAWNRKHGHLNSRDGHYPVRRFIGDGLEETVSVYDSDE